jgi:hypothetical protein
MRAWRQRQKQREYRMRRAGGPLRHRVRGAWGLPYLLFMLWHDADARWALGQGLAGVFSSWRGSHGSEASARQQAMASWWYQRQGYR